MVERCHGRAWGKETPLGWVPRYIDIDWTGLDFSERQFDEVMAIDRETWKLQALGHEELFLKLSEHLPKEMIFERELLVCRL
jgi:phosphoenolpyruvate carboxykinase (GTP)